jgi:hypothetical protein
MESGLLRTGRQSPAAARLGADCPARRTVNAPVVPFSCPHIPTYVHTSIITQRANMADLKRNKQNVVAFYSTSVGQGTQSRATPDVRRSGFRDKYRQRPASE